MNRSRKTTAESIEVLVRVDDGQFPDQHDPAVWFPIDQNFINEATVIQLNELLGFYRQNVTGTILGCDPLGQDVVTYFLLIVDILDLNNYMNKR
jgi:hypothetical protein